MDITFSPQLATPDQDLADLSFCATKPSAVSEWIADLPMANTKACAKHLRKATDELARLKQPWAERLEILEIIRPSLTFICTRLDRSATSTRDSDELAIMAQGLQNNLCVAYKAVIRDCLKDDSRKNNNGLALAVHRTLHDFSKSLLRTCQLYVAPAHNLWLEMNQLYLLAETMEFVDEKFSDSDNDQAPELSITEVYLLSALLATAKPNQLRYRQLTSLYMALCLWVKHAQITQTSEGANFRVDLQADHPPVHHDLTQHTEPTSKGKIYGLKLDLLIYELEAYLGHIDGVVEVPDAFDNALIHHLVEAWGSIANRSLTRQEISKSLKVCIGLRSVHYFVSGGIDFAEQLGTTDALLKREINPFLDEPQIAQNKGDVWANALFTKIPENPNVVDPDRILLDKPTSHEAVYQVFDCISHDISPAGYRLIWDKIPRQAHAGDLLAIRDESDPRWCLSVVRWMRQDATGAAMGIELMSPRAIPVAARIVRKKGGPSEFARSFLLPELKAIGQPASLITPSVPFEAQQKIHIQRQGIQTTAQLTEPLLITESFTQFTFRMLDGYLENAQIDLSMGKLWEMIGNDEPDTAS